MTVNSGSEPLLVVSGPTASGKSAFAVELALKIGAEIINIDSVQVYKELTIGAAKISKEEMKGVRHHLIDVFSPDDFCNVASYCKLAKEAISDIQSRGKKVLIAGGTTMYLTCLLQGLEDLPDSDPDLRKELESLNDEELFEKLSEVDPLSLLSFSRNDRIRMVRAIESSLLSGVPASKARKSQAKRPPDFLADIVVLSREREELYSRINRRTEEMLRRGLVEETRSLIEKYGKDIAPLKSLGYSQVCDFIEGRLPQSSLEGEIAMYTRRFAKRQLTYWRNEPLKKGWKILQGNVDFQALPDFFCEKRSSPNTLTNVLYFHA